MSVSHVTDASFKKDVLESSIPVLVDFWAEWCGPCRMIAPILEEVSKEKEIEGQIKIVKINIDENPQTPAQFGIRSIPTLLLFKDGAVAGQKVGLSNKIDLIKWVKSSS